MTTKEAFAALIKKKNWWEGIGVTSSAAYNFRNRLKENKPISLEKMEEILIKAGFKKIPEKWHK